MIENYILKEKCSHCSKRVEFDWQFCGHCGIYIGEKNPKCHLTYSLDVLYDYEISSDGNRKKRPEFVGQVAEKIKQAVQVNLDKGEEVADKALSPLLFVISENGVEVQKLNEEENLSSKGLSRDYKGFYTDKTLSTMVNNQILSASSKSYLINGDSIKVKNQLYIFSLMNQESVNWNQKSLEEFSSTEGESLLEVKGSSLLLKPSNNHQVLINNKKIDKEVQLKNFDTVSIDYRLFVLINDFIFYQDRLKSDEKDSIASNVHSLGKEDALSVSIKERRAGDKLLLSDINFEITSGEMLLILGGSGAGKTTLINAIMGSEKADASIVLGQKDVYREFDQVRRMIALVPQFSLHREKDSVYMTIKNAAEMKLPRDFTKDKRLLEAKITDVLRVMNLNHKRDALVSELSGGEKKRLSIATEYIADPVVFVLDEPDSGVDGNNARTIMSSLRCIANDNKIVLLISHNPDRTPELFNKVLVLVKSETENCGKLAFYGTVEETLAFFETTQLELAIAEADKRPDYYIKKFKDYIEQKKGD